VSCRAVLVRGHHRALFPKRLPAARTAKEMKAGTRRYLKVRHARD